MASFLNEQKLINESQFIHENRLKSQLVRFLDRTPTYTTYYHISNNETTVDSGYQDIESLLGSRSAFRYQKIKEFPIYGIETIIPQLQSDDQGLDTNYESDAVLLPNTIKPLPNDFFVINTIADKYIFRVTGIDFDNIRPDNFYKISYRLEFINDQLLDILEGKVKENFSCVLENIGSENNCIILDEYLDQLKKIELMYADMVNNYMCRYYNERYNCFLGIDEEGRKLYDPLQVEFINRHELLKYKNSYDTISLSDEINDPKRQSKYERSFYRYFEKLDNRMLEEFKYELYPARYRKETCFARWYDNDVFIVDVPISNNSKSARELFSHEFVKKIRSNEVSDNLYVEFIRKFIHGEITSIYDIDLSLSEQILYSYDSEELFFITPILLYMIKTITEAFLKEKNKN